MLSLLLYDMSLLRFVQAAASTCFACIGVAVSFNKVIHIDTMGPKDKTKEQAWHVLIFIVYDLSAVVCPNSFITKRLLPNHRWSRGDVFSLRETYSLLTVQNAIFEAPVPAQSEMKEAGDCQFPPWHRVITFALEVRFYNGSLLSSRIIPHPRFPAAICDFC